MPAHGNSENVGHKWSIDDCVTMLMCIIDELQLKQCIAIGQSWGSMVALRAAVRFPAQFESLCLFNMPFKKKIGLSRILFFLQKQLTIFPRFFAKQAAKSLYSPQTLNERPELITQMQSRLSQRPAKEISRTIEAVILDAEDATSLIQVLRVPALAVVGETDYVNIPPTIETITVPGGHISPHEAVEEAKRAIRQICSLSQTP